jgi:membrane protein implicated in regulation of membrane protease activity
VILMVLRLTVLAAIVTVLAGTPLWLVITALVLVLLMLAIAGRHTNASTSRKRPGPAPGDARSTGPVRGRAVRVTSGHDRWLVLPKASDPTWGETS